jgi:prevent-host-death family protein
MLPSKAELKVSVSELKSRLSEYLRQVKTGQMIVITKYGKPIGRIVPANTSLSLEEKMQTMVKAGLADWNGKKLPPMKPVACIKKGHSVADLIIKDRL